jgi:hypothetical protein
VADSPEAVFSDVESRRFDLRGFRAEVADLDEERVLADIEQNRIDVLFLRIPAAKQHELHRLGRIGVPYLVADTLVRYTADLAAEPGPLRNPDLTLVECTEADREELGALVEEIFPGYTNHYFSNPLLDPQSILDGYVEWALSYLGAQDAGRTAFFVRSPDATVGFATCSFEAGERCEGVLYGVTSSAAGQGVYTDIIRLTKGHFRDRGFRRMVVSTQVQNLAVQKAWVREAFFMSEAVVTVHLNALRGRGS